MSKHKGPFNGELNPSDSFLKNWNQPERNRKQYELLKRGAEKLRQIGAIVSVPHCNSQLAHSVLDDLIRECQSGQQRVADLHVRDIGLPHRVAHLEADSIFVVSDLANCSATKLGLLVGPMEAVGALLIALKRAVA